MSGKPVGRVALILIGVGTAAYGVVGLFTALHGQALRSALIWFVGGAVVHDLVLAPIVAAVGAVLCRVVNGNVRPYLQAGLLMSLAVTLVGLPVLSGRGYSGTNPSALPLNYWHGLLIALAIVWGATLLAAVAHVSRSRYARARRQESVQ